MIRTWDLVVDGCGGDPVTDAVGYQKIVDPPSGIVLTGIEHIAPPGVRSGSIRIQMTERICETGVQKFAKALPLFVREAGVASVGTGILQVDLPVSDIQIAADDDRLFFVQRCQITTEGTVPA